MSSSSSKVQGLELSFDGGMDQRQHPKQLGPPGVQSAVNIRWKHSGGMQKRFGTSRVAQGFRNGYALIGGKAKVIGFRDEVLVTDHYRIGSMARAGTPTPWFVDKGKVPEAVSRMRPIDTTQYLVIGPDMCAVGGLVFHAWVGGEAFNTTNGIYTTVEDANTGALIVSSIKLSTGAGPYYTPHLVVSGGTAILLYRDSLFGVGTNIYYHIWNMTTMAWGARVTLRTDSAGDIAVHATVAGDVFLLHKNTANALVIYKYNSSMVQQATRTCSEPASANLGLGLGIFATDSESVWITFNVVTATSLVKFALYPTSLGSESLAPVIVMATTGTVVYSANPIRRTATTAMIALSSGNLTMFPIVSSVGGILQAAADRAANWVTAGSKPFVTSTSPLRIMIWGYVGGANLVSSTDKNNAYTFMLLDLTAEDDTTQPWSARPVTWEAPRYSVPDGVIGLLAFWTPPSVAQVSSTIFDADFVIRKNARTRTGLANARADFASGDKFASCELGRTLFMTPGFTWDKDKLSEIGFAYFPQGITATVVPTGGTWGATTRTYIAMYEYIYASGFVERSLPSPPVVVTSSSGTTNSFEIKVPALCVTMKQNGLLTNDPNSVRIVIYVLDTVDGIYKRLFNEGFEGYNDPKQRTITLTDTGTNNAADPREILYKQSGVFGNVMPNSFTACCTYRNRVWIAYGHTVMFSKAFVTGEAVSFADEFELPLEESGDITAMWTMDDALYISTADKIYYLQADGPNDFGQQSDITQPNQIATDRGVIDQRSVAVTPIGTLYQSTVGIQLLERGRTVAQEPIGSRVQTDLAAFPEIVGTNVHPTGRYVTFSCRNAATNAGIRLVFDYSLNRWSRDTMWTTAIDTGTLVFSETICDGVVYSAVRDSASATSVIFEDTTTHLDNGAFVPMAVELAEMHPAGLQARIGVRNWQIFNERYTDHDLLMSWYKNYEPTSFESKSWASNLIAAMAPREQIAANVSVQQVQSIRMTIRDAPPTGPGAVVGTGRGATFLGLTVDTETFGMTQRLPATQKS